MAIATAPSAALIRAARAEQDRIARALVALDRRREALRAQLATLDGEAAALVERRRLLAELTGAESDQPASPALLAVPARMLKGRELRRVAARLLWQAEGDGEIQYRDWFDRVLAAGYAIGGKDPTATFLTNVRDCPAVVRGSRPGFYRLDPAARADTARSLAEAQAELRDVAAVLARPADSLTNRDQLRSHRTTLTTRLRRLEADLAELDAIFAGDDAAVEPHRPQAA
jgi:hypothetical protein